MKKLLFGAGSLSRISSRSEQKGDVATMLWRSRLLSCMLRPPDVALTPKIDLLLLRVDARRRQKVLLGHNVCSAFE